MGTYTKQFYENDALDITVDGKNYIVDVKASADYYYDPGCMYRRNGDPGDPPESEFSIEEVEAVWKDEDGNIVPSTEEMNEALRDKLQDLDGWESEEAPEPDYDYYQERIREKLEAERKRKSGV